RFLYFATCSFSLDGLTLVVHIEPLKRQSWNQILACVDLHCLESHESDPSVDLHPLYRQTQHHHHHCLHHSPYASYLTAFSSFSAHVQTISPPSPASS